MIKKADAIHNLKNVKLVIGNGFDLHCLVPTRYSDYFFSTPEKNKAFLEWISQFQYKVQDYLHFQVVNHKDFWLEFCDFENTNIWDFFFYLNSDLSSNNEKEWRWCDIESEMLKWLYNKFDKIPNYSNDNWDTVYKILSGENVDKNTNVKNYILGAVAYKKNGETKFKSQNDFYLFLLDQLKLFEKNFGAFIYHAQIDDSNRAFGIIREKTNVIRNAQITIEELCNKENLVSIDSFNYDNIRCEGFEDLLYNINGDWNSPIFGIDSNAFKAPDIRYIFSKTNRRMENDMLQDFVRNDREFSNVVVYGHSLNEADYSYFFSLLDKLDITDLTSPSKIVFAFSIYDESKGEAIKMELRSAIFKMFQEYAIYKGNNLYPNRLLDSLTSQGKVIMYEIPNIR